MNYYITKYALTKGIFDAKKERDSKSDSMIIVHSDCGLNNVAYYHKPYWHASFKEAKEHAEVLRNKKIESLNRQIKKLESLKF